jgi:hypothetical protein
MSVIKEIWRGGTALVSQPEPALPVPTAPTIDELVANFRTARGSIADGVRTSVANQIECGRLLEQMHAHIKATVGAGYWTDWVDLNCGVKISQVQRYIKKWREFQKVNQKLGSDTASMRLLAQRDLRRFNDDK